MSDTALILKAAALGRSAHREWAEFLAELRVYTDQKRDECVQAPPEILQVAQGRAQGSVALLRLLEGAIAGADRIAAKR